MSADPARRRVATLPARAPPGPALPCPGKGGGLTMTIRRWRPPPCPLPLAWGSVSRGGPGPGSPPRCFERGWGRAGLGGAEGGPYKQSHMHCMPNYSTLRTKSTSLTFKEKATVSFTRNVLLPLTDNCKFHMKNVKLIILDGFRHNIYGIMVIL